MVIVVEVDRDGWFLLRQTGVGRFMMLRQSGDG
jgi:hypothetical protein